MRRCLIPLSLILYFPLSPSKVRAALPPSSRKLVLSFFFSPLLGGIKERRRKDGRRHDTPFRQVLDDPLLFFFPAPSPPLEKKNTASE